jgi:hypothetical protein
LHEARRHRADDLAEGRVIDVAVNGIRAEELCVIESVERFQTEFEHFGLGEVGIFQQRNIPIVHSRPIKEPARGRTGRAERWRAEKRCIEIRPAVSRIVIELQRAGGNIEVSEPVAVHSVVEASDQSGVVGIDQRHRKPTAETSDTRNRPTSCRTVTLVEQLREWQVIPVAGHEVVSDVE